MKVSKVHIVSSFITLDTCSKSTSVGGQVVEARKLYVEVLVGSGVIVSLTAFVSTWPGCGDEEAPRDMHPCYVPTYVFIILGMRLTSIS